MNVIFEFLSGKFHFFFFFLQDLRKEVEKLRNEVNEREKAVENRYKRLLSESNKKLHSQEQVIRSPAERAIQEDLLLQVPYFFFLLYFIF